MDDHIEPDAFREQFADGAREIKELTGTEMKEELKNNLKQSVTKGAKMMTGADKFWLFAGTAGVIFLRDRSQRKKIKALTQLSMTLSLENEFLSAFIKGLMDPSANKNEILKDLTSKLQKLKIARAA